MKVNEVKVSAVSLRNVGERDNLKRSYHNSNHIHIKPPILLLALKLARGTQKYKRRRTSNEAPLSLRNGSLSLPSCKQKYEFCNEQSRSAT